MPLTRTLLAITALLQFSWQMVGFAETIAAPLRGSDAQTFALKKINVSGSKRFAEADIIKATGLRSGSAVTADDLKQAAARLGNSGVFSQVSYRFDGLSADFAVVDAERFVPAAFENFVWFSDADLLQRIHQSVPLFSGSLPLSGNIVDQVSSALDAILKEKGVQGHTVSMMNSKLGGADPGRGISD